MQNATLNMLSSNIYGNRVCVFFLLHFLCRSRSFSLIARAPPMQADVAGSLLVSSAKMTFQDVRFVENVANAVGAVLAVGAGTNTFRVDLLFFLSSSLFPRTP